MIPSATVYSMASSVSLPRRGFAFRHPRWVLLMLGIAGLCVQTSSNRAFEHLLRWVQVDWAGSASHAGFAFALVSVAIYCAVRPVRVYASPVADTPWPRVIRLSVVWMVVWLGGALVYGLFQGGQRAYVGGAAPVIQFLILGALGEELLFRGAVFEMAERSFRNSPFAPVLISAVLFSVHPLEFHGYELTDAALFQMAFTLPMGLVFGRIRQLTQSIWPAFALHFLTNLPHIFNVGM
jgi:membrane protease YdiL (CAAX protease family)